MMPECMIVLSNEQRWLSGTCIMSCDEFQMISQMLDSCYWGRYDIPDA